MKIFLHKLIALYSVISSFVTNAFKKHVIFYQEVRFSP
nr:MAG TPA: hypothetical protein [Caudoviricetes sp.]